MSHAPLSDAQLVIAYQKGDEKSLEILIARHRQRIFAFIISKVQDVELAEDIFQDTFFKVIRTIKKSAYTEEGKFLPWVMRIAHNLIIDHFRRNKRMPMVKGNDDFDIFDLIKDADPSADKEMIHEQMVNDLRELIKELPKEQREVLIMRHYAEMSFKDIAEHTGVSINTALGRMRYALINLRKLIEAKKMNFFME
jgi:RNA polymerase sigma factor (sigma-70 family)